MGLGCMGASSWGLSYCLRSSWEMKPELRHREPHQLGHKSIGTSPNASGSHEGYLLSRGGTLSECIRTNQLGGQNEAKARAQARDNGDLDQV